MEKKPLLPAIRFLAKFLTKFQVINEENIPNKGAVLITANHLSRLDTPLLLSVTERTDLVAIVAKNYRQKMFFRWILERVGTMVWMDREATDFSAIRESLNHLRHGRIVGIAPEGTRSRESKGLLEGKPGAALMAARAAVPIIPIAVIGSERINEYWMRLRRPPVTIRVGQPYTLPAFDFNDRQTWLVRCTDEIMCRIAALLPLAYRGFYTDHPRLKELLSMQV